MTLNTQHYLDLGRAHAKVGLSRPRTMKAGSWQYQAFMAGYKTQMGIQSGLTPLEASKEALSGRIVSEQPSLQVIPKGSSLWPAGKSQSCGCYPEGDGSDVQCPNPKTGRVLCDPNHEKPRPNSLRKTGKPAPLPESHPAHAYFQGWPPAAVEHVRFLASELADEKSVTRQKRLMKSFGRVYKRHQKAIPQRSLGLAQSALNMLST